MKISIDHYSDEELQEEGVFDWPVWEHDEDKFDWYYDQTELCYITEGEATITTEFEAVTIRAGDFVTFPKGLECVWDIQIAIQKHFSFEE
ncbi:MAG TPA: cupin domain-containing protein [Draconibacterium sp.]|nr:cupin domain-containing protein [Draconibacterium sp.]